MFVYIDDELIEALETQEIAYHNNERRLDQSVYAFDHGLQKYRVIALSHDRDGRVMVTSIEHKDYPIYF